MPVRGVAAYRLDARAELLARFTVASSFAHAGVEPLGLGRELGRDAGPDALEVWVGARSARVNRAGKRRTGRGPVDGL